MRSLRAIAALSLRHAVRTRVLLVVMAGALLLVLADLEGYGLLPSEGLAREVRVRTSGASDLLELWAGAAAIAGLFLGATAVSSDLRSRTLEAVLTRPVPRPVYLAGRWLGIQVLVLTLLAAGLCGSSVLLRLPSLDPSPALWVGLAQMALTTMLMTTLALVFGIVLRPAVAGISALLLTSLPSVLLPYLDHSEPILRWGARAAYFLGPAVGQDRLIANAFTEALLEPSFRLPMLVMVENLLYMVAAFILGCLLLHLRQIQPVE